MGDQTLPSGKYIVLTATPERSIRVVSSDGKHSAVVNTLPNYAQAASENSRLVFHKYGPEYLLVESGRPVGNVARTPLPGKRAMDIAISAGTPETRNVWSGRRQAFRSVPSSQGERGAQWIQDILIAYKQSLGTLGVFDIRSGE